MNWPGWFHQPWQARHPWRRLGEIAALLVFYALFLGLIVWMLVSLPIG